MALGFQISAAVKVSVYYETLCPYSIAFISNQLHPNYKIFDNLIELELIPYGHATEEIVDGMKTFTCQHGTDECYGNTVHGCVIEYQNISTSELFVFCGQSSSSPASLEILEKCAMDNEIPWSDIESCLSSGQGEDILEKHGQKTDLLNPTGIPTIVFNDVFNDDDWRESLNDFKAVLCKYLENEPDKCKSSLYHFDAEIK
ncbi:gamma-interferon-inducible lysosomal thiol reductase-like isoform X2 [Dendroctonus ponderosae]|uniref:Gamma-interferon-inducible lysosomal thiol reductase n=1 Tax=Dendroctonus ponderosae TaxID=77166 RepID=A0AAR5P1F1_DENPD|nr:gamma-interferon-inducible lysosomal thiol reductase isoform X2 [Dendroctonus ponderosae]XP_048521026.1 gamma-interferon-inducible lysosomal thiol reductase-like isoform X2 [Dendroctonus ponderosae]